MRRVLGALLVASVLAGCGARSSPDTSEYLRVQDVELPDGREVTCVIWKGISCDWERAGNWHRKAQVHTTLALAEQQRIANLFALAGTEDPWAFESFWALADEDDNLRPEIARALRIETP